MKFIALFLISTISVASAFGQTKKPSAKTQTKQATAKSRSTTVAAKSAVKKAPVKPKAASTPKPLDEKAEFDAATSAEPLEKVNALKKFIVDFPNSDLIPKAKELLVVARAAIADEKVRGGDAEGGVALFKLAVEESPTPIPEKLFADAISKFPYNLYWNGQRPAAFELASAIENRVSSNAPQLIAIAKFYASIENAAEAIRVAEAALKVDPNSSPAYQTIGLAHRLNFDLEASATAYRKALELDPQSLNSMQSLAEMSRALGKPEEAEKLYREMLTVAQGDVPAQTGLVLSLFDAGRRAEAETEMAKVLEADPKNVILLAGAAYWYAANGDADKAIELGEKSVAIEPRYVWSYIAWGRGLMSKQKAVDAESVLIKARAYGRFPTIEYEIARSRLAAGFYREAAEDLQAYFSVKDGIIHTKLAGRIERSSASFEELVAAERRASIFAPATGGPSEGDTKLKELLTLHQRISAPTPDGTEIGTAADEFTSGGDAMKIHRQLYAASLLLQKNVALDKVAELARAATGNTDSGLGSPNSGAAVMASELYDSRALAFSRNEFLLVPDVPRQTLSSILRGRVEDIAGWALYQQNNFPEAIIRLRRAVSVLPNPSAWWRASMWRLGAALAADGKDKEALDSYIASYKTDRPDLAKYSVVESLYKRVNNGSVEGLERQIGSDRVVTLAQSTGSATSQTTVEAGAGEAVAASPLETTPVNLEAPQPARIPRGVPIDPASIAPKTESVSTQAAEASEKAVDQPTRKAEEPVKVEEPQPKTDVVKDEGKTESAISPVDSGDEVKPSKPEAPTMDGAKPRDARKEDPSPAAVTEPTPASNGEKPRSEPPVIPIETKPAENFEQAKEEQPVSPIETKASTETEKPRTEPPASPLPSETERPKKEPSEPPGEVRTEQQPALTVDIPKGDKPISGRDPAKGGEPETVKPEPEKVDPKPPDPPPSTSARTKPLFEPIIITIPNSRPPVKKSEDSSAGSSRPRVIEGVAVKAEEITPCKIDVSQENVSLINNGGTIGLIVTVEDETAAKQLVAASNSPTDIDVKAEPDVSELSKQRLYLVRSISSTPGVYQIRFAAACGKKDVIVTVR